MQRQHIHRRGFALPTVLMASIVMLAVLAVSVSSVAAVRTSLKTQYYEQVAKAAGEAGVAYATACLAKNGNVPQWSDLTPLTPSTDCAGNVIVADCPSNEACAVMVNGSMRSMFSVGSPTLDVNGRAVSIPNNGYVELLRASNGAVWRTYKQPAAQAAVAPDLCSGAAGSALGWSYATQTTQQSALPNSAAARTISISADAVLGAGSIYLRKDFTVTDAGAYTISAQTPTSSSVASIYLDGTFLRDVQGQVGTHQVSSLSAGCHTILVKLTNKTVISSASNLTLAVQRAGAEPIVATDSTWRVSAGNTVHFSDPDYYADPSVWTPSLATRTVDSVRSFWTTNALDPFTVYASPTCDTSCTSTSTTYLRMTTDIVVPTDTTVKMYYLCDDDCSIYLDGDLVANYTYNTTQASQQTFTLTGGVPHRLGIALYNNGGSSRAAVSMQDKDTAGIVYARTDSTWQVSNTWTSGTVALGDQPKSYEASFQPSPYNMPSTRTYDVLVAAGGGGGGGACTTCAGGAGGGGGGVLYAYNQPATVGGRTVTVGAGGTAGVGGASRTRGTSGGNSVFGALTATGGGGGAAQQTGINTGLAGGSGGGSVGGGSPAAPGVAGAGISGQGHYGGIGVTTSTYGSGGGGGAGGIAGNGTTTYSGHGGPGLISMITGTRVIYGAGGGAGGYGSGTLGIADTLTAATTAGNGADAAVNAGVGYAAAANTGGGGGGGNGSTLGKAGGNGGTGVVIVRFVQGTLTIGSLTGLTYSTTTTTVNGVTYSVYIFTAGTGTFTISAIN